MIRPLYSDGAGKPKKPGECRGVERDGHVLGRH